MTLFINATSSVSFSSASTLPSFSFVFVSGQLLDSLINELKAC
jgi:hypothetical protein